jgi:hypothetical protein
VTNRLTEYDEFPLLKAPRDIRLKAAELFDTLLEELKELAERKIKVLEQAEELAKTK